MSAAPSYPPGSGDRVRGDEWVVERSTPVRGTGFFANETRYEVHTAGAEVDETYEAFFVPESELDRYSEDELTLEGEDGQAGRRRYDPGTFIFSLAGRDRETSATYYTPEVPTRVGHDRKTFEAWQGALDNGDSPPSEADTARYFPPFETREREADMRHAYQRSHERLRDRQ